jgi:DNA relaxase NicK
MQQEIKAALQMILEKNKDMITSAVSPFRTYEVDIKKFINTLCSLYSSDEMLFKKGRLINSVLVFDIVFKGKKLKLAAYGICRYIDQYHTGTHAEAKDALIQIFNYLKLSTAHG